MMTDDKFEEWLLINKISPEASAVIRMIRKSQPSRLVRSSAGGNISSRYPAKKMGLTIQAESHHVELAAIYIKEYDPKVLEYYDQPPPILLQYTRPNGRKLGHYHTPDFFTIWEDTAGWEEWKPESKLEKISLKNPGRYYKDESGVWRCPPGEDYARKYGLYYRVHSSAEINGNYYRNSIFLEDYLRADGLDVPKENEDKILSSIRAREGITLAEVLQTIDPSDVDALYILIAQKKIYVDLEAAPLAEPDLVKLFTDPSVSKALTIVPTTYQLKPAFPTLELKPNAMLTWDNVPWHIVNVGDTEVSLINDREQLTAVSISMFRDLMAQGRISGMPISSEIDSSNMAEARELIFGAGPLALKEANRRSDIVRRALQGEKAASLGVAERTLRVWTHNYLAAQAKYGYGYLGLLPKHKNKGTYGSKLQSMAAKKIQEFIETDYLEVRAKTKATVYRTAKLFFEKAGLQPLSYKTFWMFINMKSQAEQKGRREGPKAAYSLDIKHFSVKRGPAFFQQTSPDDLRSR